MRFHQNECMNRQVDEHRGQAGVPGPADLAQRGDPGPGEGLQADGSGRRPVVHGVPVPSVVVGRSRRHPQSINLRSRATPWMGR